MPSQKKTPQLKRNRTQRRLQIELVPKPLWGQSLATLWRGSKWDRIRHAVYDRQQRLCGICGADSTTLYCHERWEYNDETHVATLVGFIAICVDCNNCVHMGRTTILADSGKVDFNKVVRHYCSVNSCTSADREQDYKDAFRVWQERSQHEWINSIPDDIDALIAKDSG
jgi:hypothetical protein